MLEVTVSLTLICAGVMVRLLTAKVAGLVKAMTVKAVKWLTDAVMVSVPVLTLLSSVTHLLVVVS